MCSSDLINDHAAALRSAKTDYRQAANAKANPGNRIYLRSHPVRRSNHRVSLLITLNIGTEAKVSHFDSSINPEQDVVRLDITMYDSLKAQTKMHVMKLVKIHIERGYSPVL